MDLALNNLQKLIYHKTPNKQTLCKQKLYLYKTDLFELELFD